MRKRKPGLRPFILRTTIIFVFFIASTFFIHTDSFAANDTEFMAITMVQSASLPHLKTHLAKNIEKSFTFQNVRNPNNDEYLFAQQDGVYPANEYLQLPNFGAKLSWDEILTLVRDVNYKRKLLIMIRHGEAWENLNPIGNNNCEFNYNGEIIQNFDSALSPLGINQSTQLNILLNSFSLVDGRSNISWFDTIGLSNSSFFSSPLTRTLQTAQNSLLGLPVPGIITTELMRASIGTDVCNFRRSVHTNTNNTSFPAPWNTNCIIPSDNLLDIYSSSKVKFLFPIRPAGGPGIGLVSDADQLWRSDVADDTQATRARAFINELFQYVQESVACVVTHSEMIDAMYTVMGNLSYSALNTQLVPIIIEAI